MSGPLTGFKIIDVCRAGPGQLATGILADYGADVISIVEAGYQERQAGGSNAAIRSGRPSVNRRNKRSIFLNLRSPEGLEVFFKLAKASDAILESNRPGVAKQLGIHYEAVSAFNPGIVYCALSSFGQYGPYAGIAAHDPAMEAVAGSLPQDDEGNLRFPPYSFADHNASWAAATSILMGLLERTRSGKGQYIDVSFVDATVTIPPGGRGDEALQGKFPCVHIYETKDGKFVTLSIREPWFWERMCKLINKPEWVSHIRPEGKLRDEMFAFFRATFKQKSQAEWVDLLKTNDIEFGPVNKTEDDLRNDPHLRAREMVLELKDPATGEVKPEVGFAFKFQRTRPELRHGPTLMGHDTQAVLGELGYSAAQIAKLRAAKVTA